MMKIIYLIHATGYDKNQANQWTMSLAVLKRIVGSFVLPLSLAFAASVTIAASPDLLKAKKEAEAVGYTFIASHDEIVAMAKKEGKLRVNSGLEPQNFKALVDAFKQKYPFLTDVKVEGLTGTEANQRFLLEIKAGQAKGWDIANIRVEFANEYLPHLTKHDMLGMAKHGVLKIHPSMIHPTERNVVGVLSVIRVLAYNRMIFSEDKLPDKWEDFLKPEFKGKKFVMDIRPVPLAALVPVWGLERTLDFTRKLAAQQPVWGRGAPRIAASLVSGEHSIFAGANFASTQRAIEKDRTGSLGYKIVEPVPTETLTHSMGILKTADQPHAALLWIEFLASAEGQEIIDKYEPLAASVLTPGSALAQVTRGKQLSIVNWSNWTDFQENVEKLFATAGFPKGE